MSTMSSTSERITAAELERSKRARVIAQNWLAAENTRLQLAGLDPALENNGIPGAQGRSGRRPSALDRIREARVSGLEIKEFSKGIGEEASTSKSVQVNPSTLLEQRGLIIRSLVAAGRTPEQIESYLFKVAPFLDVVATAGADPMTQSLLYSRLMSGNGQQSLGVRDIIEVIGMVNQMKGTQRPQSDIASVIAALGSFLAATKNNNGSDVTTIQTLYGEMNKQAQASFDRQLELLREKYSDAPTFEDQLQHVMSLQKTLGLGKESEAVSLKRMDLETQRWSKQQEIDADLRKSKSQNEMVRTITGNLQKALESPVIRELGKNVGSKIGVRENPVEKVRTAAAQTQLREPPPNPMDEVFGLTCAICKNQVDFTRSELVRISEAGGGSGKWSCPHCAAVYVLKPPDKDKTDESGGATVA
jgi:hypothetical protein